MKKVSILIPAHNEEKYIGKCLDSILSIKTEEIEIIVCDNNSTDTTCEIIKKYPQVILVHETKIGPNAARQKAFSISTGEIIATLDADCIVSRNWVTSAVLHFKKEHVVAVSGVCFFNGSKLLNTLLYIATNYIMRFLHFLLHRILHTKAIMLAGNAWYRRSTLEKIGGFATDIEFFGDDAHTAAMLAREGRIIYDPNVSVITSSRRFDQEGAFTVAYRYALNYLGMWTVKKQITPKNKTRHYR